MKTSKKIVLLLGVLSVGQLVFAEIINKKNEKDIKKLQEDNLN